MIRPTPLVRRARSARIRNEHHETHITARRFARSRSRSSLHVRSDAGQDQHARSASRPLQHFDEALLSKPSHRVRIENDVRVTMRDGVTVSVDIYRPMRRAVFHRS